MRNVNINQLVRKLIFRSRSNIYLEKGSSERNDSRLSNTAKCNDKLSVSFEVKPLVARLSEQFLTKL